MFSNYDELVAYSISNPNKLILIDFNASWCGPCKTLKPFLEYLKNEYPNVDFHEIDIEDGDLATITEHFEIAKVPTLVYIKNGNICQSIIGTNKENIENAINEHL
jgi:thioredoxin 1